MDISDVISRHASKKLRATCETFHTYPSFQYSITRCPDTRHDLLRQYGFTLWRGEERFREEGETAKKDREKGERKQKK